MTNEPDADDDCELKPLANMFDDWTQPILSVLSALLRMPTE
jgi:hypothetical protein